MNEDKAENIVYVDNDPNASYGHGEGLITEAVIKKQEEELKSEDNSES